MKTVYIENGTVVLEVNGEKTNCETFVAAAEALGDGSYDAADAIAKAVNDHGVYEAA